MNFRYLVPQHLMLRILYKSILLKPLIRVINFPFMAANVISLWNFKWDEK